MVFNLPAPSEGIFQLARLSEVYIRLDHVSDSIASLFRERIHRAVDTVGVGDPKVYFI